MTAVWASPRPTLDRRGWAVPYVRPVFPRTAEIAADIEGIVAANWYTNFGPIERTFASGLAAWLDCDRVVTPTANATSGLLAAVRLLMPPKRPGFVIVPSYTFAAGPAAIRWSGHRPLFIDIDPATLQPSLSSAKQALAAYGDSIVGILLGNSFGIGNAEVRAWEALAAEVGLPLVVDSAAGFGSRYPDGRPVGSAGDCEVFSFHATKPFAIGEGGAVACRTPELDEQIRSFINFGFVSHEARWVGLNGKLQELNAAIGLRQLATFDNALASRRAALAALAPSIEGAGLELPAHQEISSVSAAIVLAADQRRRDSLLDSLTRNRVEARVYYAPAVHLQEAFRGETVVGDLVGTAEVGRRVIALPIHQDMAQSSIDLIADAMLGRRGVQL